MAQNAGCTTYIANGDAEYPLSSVLRGHRKYTVCLPHPNPVSLWETWLGDRLQMAGSIKICEEAAQGFDGESAIWSYRPANCWDINPIRSLFARKTWSSSKTAI